MKNKILNFRAMYIIALFVTAAVSSIYAYAYNAIAGIAIGCILGAAAIVAAACSIIFFRKSRCRLRMAIACCIALAAYVCSFSIGVAFCNEWNSGKKLAGYRLVSGRVNALDVSGGEYRVNLDELKIDGAFADGLLRLKIGASDNNIGDLVKCGDILEFKAKIRSVDLASGGGISGYSYRTDIRYTATVKSADIAIAIGQPTIRQEFMSSLRNLYVENMGDKYGNIVFSMFTGDRYGLDRDIFDYFSAAGLGHIMAVSGLHIGFFAVLLNVLLAKVGKKPRFAITTAVLFAYMALADFSPSVVRAFIMATVTGIATIIGARRDLMSSMLCAYSIILSVRPLYLFEAGFVLSFGAIFGIALFSNSIRRGLSKLRMGYKLGNALGGSVAASAGICPAQIFFFSRINILAWLINSIVIPYISVVFIAIICLSPIAAMPSCGILLEAGKYLLIPLDYTAVAMSGAAFTVFARSSSAVVLLCYPAMFVGSEYILLNKRPKLVVCSSCAVICVVLIAICFAL